MIKALLILLICGTSEAFLVSCTADETEYERGYRCYFTFDTSIHNTSMMLGCINPMSSGLFCMAWQETKEGVRHIKVQLGNGKDTEDNAITTALETRQQCTMGAGNGLIIGCSTLNTGQLYAYDRLCPNCLKAGTNKPLQWDNSGLWVKCTRCQRSYDLNNSGYVVAGDPGNKLLRYRSSYNGTMLIVSN